MATGTGGGSVQQTAAVSLPLTAGVVFAGWLAHPVWPPPQEVLTIAVGVVAPAVHLVGRAVYRRLTAWAGETVSGEAVAP